MVIDTHTLNVYLLFSFVQIVPEPLCLGLCPLAMLFIVYRHMCGKGFSGAAVRVNVKRFKCSLLESAAGELLLRILLASFLTIHILGDLLLIIQHLHPNPKQRSPSMLVGSCLPGIVGTCVEFKEALETQKAVPPSEHFLLTKNKRSSQSSVDEISPQ